MIDHNDSQDNQSELDSYDKELSRYLKTNEKIVDENENNNENNVSNIFFRIRKN